MDDSATSPSPTNSSRLALNGRVALVTGSSRGIGAAIASRFAREGAAVAVHGRDASAARSVRDRIVAAGGRAIAVVAELTDFAAIERMRASIEQEFGPIDILVANAGGNPTLPGPIEDVSEGDWRAAIDVNLTATFLAIKCFLPGMKARGRGSIVTMSSAAARRPTEMSPAPYGAAKAGIQSLTRSVALQAGPFGVRANTISPETILTESNLLRIPGDVQGKMAASHPIRRLGTPEDVAQAALYLVGDESSWITGAVLDVAGGSVLA
ncbi:SDR family NAD(P)-dependent oxidoreductase [Rathayibacter soli]|uniref:SDR family NAD(P)-dependent oxidoreductase n=1 Tax=Rathayibacter soli TaxID=3144168 RepID=UPI0027E50145|nr:SDR family NAD(P)-dependent oxidoreductase [Glaciibacter superstes]